MKVHPQILSQQGNPLFVVLPYTEYATMLDLLEDIVDIKAVEASKQDKTERFPLELVERIAAGNSPIKIFREYRKLSQTTLAKKVKVSKQYISQIEAGSRKGSIAFLKKVAAVLKVDVDDLIV